MSPSDLGDTVVHAYGVLAAGAQPPLPPAGIDEAPVTVVQADGVSALVSVLDEARFGEAAWRDHGEEPRWLERVARDHHAVLQAVTDEVDVLPLRLPGIYSDEAALRAVLDAHAADFRTALERIGGHQEWGVKVFRVRAVDGADERPAPTSGRDYLTRRAQQAGSREEARNRRSALVLDTHEHLTRAATHAAVSPPQDRALTGRPEPMLLNGAYLVARERRDAFLELADRLGQRLEEDGMVLEVTGPWPPYSFAELPASDGVRS